jgi:type II secretory pathway component GspD/PulD (secretin)
MRFALNIMLKPLKLSYAIEDQVLKITSETKGRNVRVTYPIMDLVITVDNHPLPDSLNIVKALERSMQPMQGYPNYMAPPMFANSPGTVVSSHGQGYASDPTAPGGYSLTQPPGTNVKRGPDEMAKILMELIRNAIAKNSWEEMGGTGNIQFFPFGAALVINQTQEVQEEVQQLLASLRRLQDLQVSVELRAVLVSETFFERIGVDFDMNLRTPTSRREPDLVNGTFVPAPFVNRTADRLNGLVSGLTSAGTLTPDLNIPIRNSSFNFTTPQFGGYQPEAGISLGLAFLSDIQVFMFLEAVQGDRRAHIMQAPKITVFNGQLATIGGFMSRPQVTGVIPTQLGNGMVVMMPNLSQIPFGMGMTVQPTVSPDRRFIRLNVSPQAAAGQQDPAAATLIVTPGTVQGPLDGGGQAPPFASNPLNVQIIPTQVSLTIANTTVNVPDGGTVLLGGFRFLAEERTEYGPPILSKIPYLSRLFRNVGWSRDGSTLVYLVTARVIMVEEEERLFMGEIAPIPGR